MKRGEKETKQHYSQSHQNIATQGTADSKDASLLYGRT